MSTKIFDGYRLPPGLTVDGLPAWIEIQKKWVAPLRVDMINRAIFRQAREAFSLNLLAAHGLRQVRDQASGLEQALVWARGELENLARGIRSPEIDAQAELFVVYRPHRAHQLYARMITESKEMTEGFSSLPGVREFSYTNSTDAPSYISQERYNRRGQVWRHLFDGMRDNHYCSLTFDLATPPCLQDLETSCLHDPGFQVPDGWHQEYRFPQRAHHLAMSSLALDQLPEGVRVSLDAGRFSGYMAFERECSDGKHQFFNDVLAQVSAIVPPRIETSWLHLSYPEMKRGALAGAPEIQF